MTGNRKRGTKYCLMSAIFAPMSCPGEDLVSHRKKGLTRAPLGAESAPSRIFSITTKRQEYRAETYSTLPCINMTAF